jgi:hypothetical protein
MANLIPVDHDPFADAAPAGPNLIPVDHDPFADGAPAGPNLIPVDHDPFADAADAGPNLIPVDHDPFADAAPAAPNLLRVDYDPFAAPTSGPDPSTLEPTSRPDLANSASSNSLGPFSPWMMQSTPPAFSPFADFSSTYLTQSTPTTSAVPVSYQSTERPWWEAPPSPFEPWADQFIKGIQGLIEFFNRSRRPSGNPNAPGCKEEWAKARADCAEWISQRDPPRGVTGGYQTIEDRARGVVSERCGGTRIDR